MDYETSFINFPFRQLQIKVHRRDFFYALLKEIKGATSAFNQKPTFSIADLGTFPLDDLMNIIPALNPGCEFKLSDGMVLGKPPRHLEFINLFPVDSSAHNTFQFFNHSVTLLTMSRSVRKRFLMDDEKSKYFVRGLFLFLTEEGFAYPKNVNPNHD
jgi:hypothetical protein